MAAYHEDNKKHLQEVELILQYLTHPENLTASDSEHVIAILAERALTSLHKVMTSE